MERTTATPAGRPENEQVEDSIKALRGNLEMALGMDLGKHTYQVGPKLHFDPQREKLVDNAKADELLTRDYREPFVVTEEV